MTLAERVLYHQIHPLKLFTDITTVLIAIDFFWQHLLVNGLFIAVVPSVLVSAALMREADLESYRRGAMGEYLRRYMTPLVQALRLFGAVLAFDAAWFHFSAGVLAGLALIVGCWGYGVVWRRVPR